ncbi:hypothetical protein [Halococcus agarilyticus]|uniref:hypothetical protein n=1 Tax=Halococcus agarilyticus TaxID=1232219 RepID=UPI000677970E|nr:hypothetical protein [Halococcus agarilyticus]
MDDERSAPPEPPTRLADGALAAAVLVLAVAVIRITRIDVSPSAILLGAGSTVGFELLAGRDPERVRRVWARRGVRAAVVGVALALGVLAVVVRAAWFVVAGAGALGCYLIVLALVAWGIVPPPESWTDGP